MMQYILICQLGLPSEFNIQGVRVAQVSINGWPHEVDARRTAAAVAVFLLNRYPAITDVVAGVIDEQSQVCAAHATHDLIMFDPALYRSVTDMILQIVKVAPFDCACFDGQPASAGAFTCPALHLRPHGPPAPQLLTIDLNNMEGA